MPKTQKRRRNIKPKKKAAMPKARKRKTAVRQKKKANTRMVKPEESVVESTVDKSVMEKAPASGDIEAAEAIPFGLETPQPTIMRKEREVWEDIEGDENKIEDYGDISEEKTSILSIVRDLEGQVETALELKEVVEADLGVCQKKLSEELVACARLEAQVKSLEGQAAVAEQLREDISFAEEERNKFAGLLAEIQEELKAVTDERDSLADQMASSDARVKELEGERTSFEAQVMNLKDRVADMDSLRQELGEVTNARRGLAEQVQDLSSRLEASEASGKSLEMDLARAHEALRDLREDGKGLRQKLMSAEKTVADLRVQLDDQQVAKRDLMETRTRLQREINNHGATRSVLEALKKAMHDIRSEAARTSGRVRRRFQAEGREPKAGNSF